MVAIPAASPRATGQATPSAGRVVRARVQSRQGHSDRLVYPRAYGRNRRELVAGQRLRYLPRLRAVFEPPERRAEEKHPAHPAAHRCGAGDASRSNRATRKSRVGTNQPLSWCDSTTGARGAISWCERCESCESAKVRCKGAVVPPFSHLSHHAPRTVLFRRRGRAPRPACRVQSRRPHSPCTEVPVRMPYSSLPGQ